MGESIRRRWFEPSLSTYVAFGVVLYTVFDSEFDELLFGPCPTTLEDLVLAPIVWGAVSGVLFCSIAASRTVWQHARRSD